MTEDEEIEEREKELDALEAQRECRYGGCRCCALLVKARREIDEARKLAQELLTADLESEGICFLETDLEVLFKKYPWLKEEE